MRRRLSIWTAAGIVMLATGCDGGGVPLSDSKSNWLHACMSSEDCGAELSCVCGVCSTGCEQDDDCAGEVSARCQNDLGSISECPGSTVPSGSQCVAECATRADCPQGTLCYEAACVREVAPMAPGCESTLDWSVEDASFELDILAALNDFRAASRTCEGMSVAAQKSVTLHFGLRCAARLHTLDMVTQGYFDVTSPSGEGVAERLQTADYESRYGTLVISTQVTGDGINQTFSEACDTLLKDDPLDAGAGVMADRWSLILAEPR